MNGISLTQLASVSDLQRSYSTLVERVKRLAKPIFLLRRNQPEAVLVSIAEYQDMAEKGRLFEEQMALSAIAEFEKDKKTGKLITIKSGQDLYKL